jgi:uncharacterized membrane protein
LFGCNCMLKLHSVTDGKDTLVPATEQLLREHKISVTSSTIAATIEEHPDYPSILSISDALQKWKIGNTCVQVEPDNLNDLPVPFIAYFQKAGGKFVTVKKITDQEVAYSKGGAGLVVRSREDFLKEWSGIALLAEPTAESGEQGYRDKRRQEWWRDHRISLMAIAVLVLVAARAFSAVPSGGLSAVLTMLTMLIKLGGVVVTGFLLWYEVDQQNPLLQKICSAGKKSNCSAVLQSKEARLFGWLTWSEIGFYYFTGTFLFLLLGSAGLPALGLVAWLNLAALPYTVFSVYYQRFVARQWCPLCLIVQGLLVLEFLDFYFAFWRQSWPHSLFNNGGIFLVFITSLLIPVFFWAFVKPFLIKSQNGDQYRKELMRLKHNPEIFEGLLVRQREVTQVPEGLGITLGNPQAAHTVIKVCNPYCGPCAKAHPLLEELLNENENVLVKIIFMATNEEHDRRAKPVRHLMAIFEKNDQRLIKKALDDWYLPEEKDYDVFAAKYPMNGELDRQNEKLAAMEAWCKESQILHTPTIFVDGHELPDLYAIGDLKDILS